jgi:hypothetical protein
MVANDKPTVAQTFAEILADRRTGYSLPVRVRQSAPAKFLPLVNSSRRKTRLASIGRFRCEAQRYFVRPTVLFDCRSLVKRLVQIQPLHPI